MLVLLLLLLLLLGCATQENIEAYDGHRRCCFHLAERCDCRAATIISSPLVADWSVRSHVAAHGFQHGKVRPGSDIGGDEDGGGGSWAGLSPQGRDGRPEKCLAQASSR
jgi:hypothetical protein